MKDEKIKLVCPNPKCNEISEFKIQSPIWWYLANYEKMLIGITSKLNNGNHVFFAEIDGKDGDENNINEAINSFKTQNLYQNLIVIETPKGFHLISLNEYTWADCISMYSKLLENNHIDKIYSGYSIARGFATLRLSKKTPKESNFKLFHTYRGRQKISSPHHEIYQKIVERPIELFLHHFDKGFELVGYPYREAK